MRSLFASAVLTFALSLAPAAALAQSSANGNVAQSDGEMTEQSRDETPTLRTADQRGPFLTAQTPGQILFEDYIGASVLIGSGEARESIGTISQLIFDENDTIAGVVVDVGGFLGIGAKPVGLQWDALKEIRTEESIVFTTALTREDFENAPAFQDLQAQRDE